VGSFLAAAALNFGLVLLGMNFVVLLFPGMIGRMVNELALMSHLASVSRGVVDFRDLLYFVTLILIALTLTVIKLSERKVAEAPEEKKKLWLIMALVVGLGIAGNVLMAELPLRADLTANRRYSLSRGTQQLLKQLPDRLTVSLYTSQNLPGPMQVALRETGDWLKDYQRVGKKVTLRTVFTDASAGNKQEALQRGIREVQFNQIGSNSFQVQTGFLGLELRYGDKTEVIEFIEDSSNLEYQLSRAILKLTQENEGAAIGLFAHTMSPLSQAENLLRQQYQVSYLSEDSTWEEMEKLTGLVVIDDGQQETATAAGLIDEYIQKGGNVAAFMDSVTVDRQALSAQPSQSAVLATLKNWGITMNPGLVFDMQLNESVTMGQGSVRYIIPYPFWIRTLVQAGALPSSHAVTNALLGWASELAADMSEEWTVRPLLKTSQAGGVEATATILNPQMLTGLPQPSGEKMVGIAAERGQQRLVVISDSDLLSDEFLANTQENQILAANIIDWIAADPILNQIPRRADSRSLFTFTSASQAATVQYVNIGGPALFSAVFGGWWLWRRRRASSREYRKGDKS
jgi:ABC-2 type transport system permease protein